MSSTEKITKQIFGIDQMWMGNPKFTSSYLLVGDTLALLDSGPSTVIEQVLASVAELGYSPYDISYLIYSHIHVDHAGGAGLLCKQYPHLKVLVHEKGVTHLADPEKLCQSMKQVFGDNADLWYGEVMPVPQNQLQSLKDTEIIDLGKDLNLKVFHTPGHAVHHLSLYDEKNAVLFAGEALGVYFPEADVYFPSTPPPEFDLVGAVDSVERLARQAPNTILYAHFGQTPHPQTALKKAKETLVAWGSVIRQAMNESDERAFIMKRLTDAALESIEHLKDQSEMYDKYKHLIEFRSNYTCGPGYIRYFKKGGQVL